MLQKVQKKLFSVNLVSSCLLASAIGGVGSLAVSAPANAFSLESCSPSIADNVTGTTACQLVTPATGSANDSAPVVNGLAPVPGTSDLIDGGFFGIQNWVLAGRQENLPDGKSGTYNISSFLASLPATQLVESVMLVFKDGKNSTLTGYLLDQGVTTGTWETPFVSGTRSFDVSHISVYVSSTSTTAVPEPTTMLGILAAGALGAAWKRKYGQNQKIAS